MLVIPCPLVGDFSRSLSQARPLVEAEFRDIDAEEWSDGGARPLDERTLLGYKDVNLLTTCD
ncbi:hypothetical protein FFV08_00505 [Streptococcus sanguinis]|uniref:Uncharacterized protein n=1 Tax=Streptococcus sanguinis TaxID=1305 RepID=A0A7H8V4T8_STRSA|nr:hypothetical protein FFV08_00505 [Streptococcus sanguinis]